ncbi:relaxase/mobilization nuclease domain-containing protein [Desertivirga arenae]|uniref:relaxase/mobilization nuclease domain-containing protein n=1 Tax=Desertivirga arenae TaxID=2810309 RepID=UPI001A975A47|nr:relaxase/mobilization nuclease domain-containing protein [Pedobacter sp. SYSU D00823]
MIVKILNKSSQEFSAVRYNDDKVNKGTGELMTLKNLPYHINASSSQGEVKDYLKSIKNDKVKNKQFHAVLSTEKRLHSKEVLAVMADKFMDKMGYGKQPYLVVYHNDTDNNHVHIVSTRVDKDTLKGISDSYEKLKAQSAMREIMQELYGVNQDERLDKLLTYTFSNLGQLEKLLTSSGYQTNVRDNALNIIHNGVLLKSLSLDSINYTENRDEQRKKQIYAILNRYMSTYSNNVFQVFDQRTQKTAYVSELQKQLREKMGIDINFAYKDDKTPFGYLLIDHKTNAIFKGGDIMKMGDLFNFTSDKIDKQFFDILTNYNIFNNEIKSALKSYLESQFNCEIKDYMLFGQATKVPYPIYDETKNITKNFIENYKDMRFLESKIAFVENENKVFVINKSEHKIFDLRELVGEQHYNWYLRKVNDGPYGSHHLKQQTQVSSLQQTQVDSKNVTLSDLLTLNSASDYFSPAVTAEEDEQKRRKRKRR